MPAGPTKMERFEIGFLKYPCILGLILCVIIFQGTFLYRQSYESHASYMPVAGEVRDTADVILQVNTTEVKTDNETDTLMKLEQQRRFQILEKGCKTLNLSRSLPHLGVRYTGNFLVDDKYKILFHMIPKVGCRTWDKVFNELYRTHANGSMPHLSTYEEKERQYRLDNYHKAVFVREPIKRLLSMYLSKFHKSSDATQRIWENEYGNEIVQVYRKGYVMPLTSLNAAGKPYLNVTFSEWIQYITDKGLDIKFWNFPAHFIPQNVIVSPCAIKYDFIGHFENLKTEAPYMIKYLGVDHAVAYPPFHESRAEKRLVNEYQNISLDLMKRLHKYYYDDYILFGYSFFDTLKSIASN